MTHSQLEKRITFLTWYAGGLTLLLLIFIFGAFVYSGPTEFEEIDAERINIVEPDGQLALVISNAKRMPGALIEGKLLTDRKGIPGIIFYNSEGDESGGLIFDTRKTDSTLAAYGHLSFDRYKQDQVVVLQYMETPSLKRSGLMINDRPEMNIIDNLNLMEAVQQGDKTAQKKLKELQAQGKMTARRVFVGTRNDAAELRLYDTFGNMRIRIAVDTAGVPAIEFLNKSGEVTYRLPEEQ